MRALAKQVAAAGIRRISGDIIGDDRAFEAKPVPDGWRTRYLHASYAARVSALSLNENLVHIVVTPGRSGQPGTVRLEPATTAYTRHEHVDHALQESRRAGRRHRRRRRHHPRARLDRHCVGSQGLRARGAGTGELHHRRLHARAARHRRDRRGKGARGRRRRPGSCRVASLPVAAARRAGGDHEPREHQSLRRADLPERRSSGKPGGHRLGVDGECAAARLHGAARRRIARRTSSPPTAAGCRRSTA